MADLSFELEIRDNLAQLDARLEEAKRDLKDLADRHPVKVDTRQVQQAQKEVGKLKKRAAEFGEAFATAGLAAGAALALIGREALQVTAEFEKLEAVLQNTLGSGSLAQLALNDVKTIAASSNFSVRELTDSYVKLTNRGIQPTKAELVKLSDIANSTGKSFDQLTEAALDAMTGEFERLKEFGIRASSQGDKVQFTFKGVTTEVQKTDGAIKDYLLSLGELNGVQGATAQISATLGGAVSNLGDAYDNLLATLGKETSSANVTLIKALTEALSGAAVAAESARTAQKRLFAERLGANLEQLGPLETTEQIAAAQAKVKAQLTATTAEADKLAGVYAQQLKLQEAAEASGNQANASAGAERLQKLSGQYDKVIQKERSYSELLSVLNGKEDKLKLAAEQRAQVVQTANKQLLKDLAALRQEFDFQINADLRAGAFEPVNYADLFPADPLQAALADINREFAQEFNLPTEPIINAKTELAALSETFAGLETREAVFGEAFDLTSAKIEAIKEQLNSLLEQGFSAQAEPVQALVGELQKLEASATSTALNLQSTFSAISSSLGQNIAAFATGAQTLQQTVKSIIGSVIQSLINAAITAIASGEAIKTSFSGIGAIAFASVAAAAAGSFFNTLRPMATGGIAYGPTAALVGEYPGASQNPEVVAPLSDLMGMVVQAVQQSGGGGGGTLSIELKGSDLLILLQRAQRAKNAKYNG